jgi:hypothetical protein
MGQPYIQVRGNYLGELPGGKRYYHTLIVVDDGNGNKTYYRGGPENRVSSPASDTTRGGSGSDGRGFGRVVGESGSFEPGGRDYEADAIILYQANLNPEDVPRIKNRLNNQMNAITEARIDYFPTGPNSNSTTGTVLRNIGIDLQIPDAIWVPGFDQQLVDHNGRRVSIEAEGTRVAATSGMNTTEGNLRDQSEKVYTKTLATAPKDLTLTDDQRVAKALIAANFDAPSVAAVIENGSSKAKNMDESAKGDYAQGVVKTAEANKEDEASKLASASKSVDRGIEA